ncbi:unnamed protein product [Cylicocyclus nassatus]|uniref:NADAR domain-containing protein n=1 Tax=Cylicocyclus nassatus TaxID=53992 RepID=A0AA36HDD5_CYLNA|nr:unnamed protein product [Cylicocyclus nassatus]
MNSNYRGSFVSWKTSNTLSNPYNYPYGYRQESGPVGYNPDFPSIQNVQGSSTYYQQQQYNYSQGEYNPAFPSYSKPIYSRDYSFRHNRGYPRVNNSVQQSRGNSRAAKLKTTQSNNALKGNKSKTKAQSTTESSSTSSQVLKAEDALQSDDQKPGKVRPISSEKPDISVLKIISPKKNTKHPRKSHAGKSETGTKRGASTSSGFKKNMSYMPFGGMPRGNFPMMRGGRGGRGGGRRFAMKPNNNPMDIPFKPLSDDAPAISLTIDPDNFICFHGFSSIFTTQHTFPVLIDGKIYESGDHYYQIQKVHDLCGTVSDKLTETVRDEKGRRLDGKVGFSEHRDKSFSQIAKDVIRLNNVDKKKVDEWRYSRGLEVMQKALLAKVSQSVMLRQALSESGKKILVHAFPGDSIYGAGCRHAQVKKWCESMKANGATTIRIPATFPLTSETVVNCPNFAQGRNVLGVILMQLREMLRENKVPIVDLSSVFDSLRVGNNNVDPSMDDQDCGDGFAIGGGSIQAKIGGGTTKT